MSYNILITSAGQRVSLVRAFQKELKLIEDAIESCNLNIKQNDL